KLIKTPAIKSALPGTVLTRSKQRPGLSGKLHPMPGNKWSVSATWVKTAITRQAKPNSSNQRPTVIAESSFTLSITIDLASLTAEFTPPRCVTGHKLDIQRYKGRVTSQIATLLERAA